MIISSAQRLKCNRQNESAFTNSRAKSRSLVASMLFARLSHRTQARRHESAIQRQSCARHGARSQRTYVHTLAAIGKPVAVAQKHFDISQQPMRDQHRFRMLQMRVSRHCGICQPAPRDRQTHAHTSAKSASDLVDRSPHKQTQIGRNLFIAAASAMQFVSECRRSAPPVASRQNDARLRLHRLEGEPSRQSAASLPEC